MYRCPGSMSTHASGRSHAFGLGSTSVSIRKRCWLSFENRQSMETVMRTAYHSGRDAHLRTSSGADRTRSRQAVSAFSPVSSQACVIWGRSRPESRWRLVHRGRFPGEVFCHTQAPWKAKQTLNVYNCKQFYYDRATQSKEG